MTQEAKVLLGIGIVTIAILVGAVFFLNQTTPVSTKGPVDEKLLIKNDSNKIASDSAKVTIVEFGDYQCPACRAAFPNVNRVLKDYSGKVNFVFRHFPLPQHQNALSAAEAAEAAGEQGKYWQMHDLLYENQPEWSESADPLGIFSKYAASLNLNVEQFKNFVSTNKYHDKILSDKSDGEKLGINSTPTFYINGIKLPGYSYEDFKSRIDEASK